MSRLSRAAATKRAASAAANGATGAWASSGIRMAWARAWPWPSTPGAPSASRRWRTRRSWYSPSATISTINSSGPSRAARTCCANRLFRRQADSIFASCCGLFHGFDRSKRITGTPQERIGLLPAAQEHILAQNDGKGRFLRAVRELSQTFALAVPHEKELRIRDDVAFSQAVQSVLAKRAPGEARPEKDLDHTPCVRSSRARSRPRG